MGLECVCGVSGGGVEVVIENEILCLVIIPHNGDDPPQEWNEYMKNEYLPVFQMSK